MARRLRRVCPWARSILALALVTVVLLQLSRWVYARDLSHVGVGLYHLHFKAVALGWMQRLRSNK